MADRDQKSTQEGVRERDGSDEMEKHLSPRTAEEQEYPEEVRPPTPLEEAGEEKGSANGLTDRDVG